MRQVRPGTAVRGAHTSWRALTAGEAVLAVLLDVLVVALPAVAVGVGLGSGVLAWMVALETVVLLVLVEARSGRTPGLLAVSAASSAPSRGSAPGLGRASARAVLRLMLPLQRRTGEAAGPGARQSVLDLLTGTVTVTSRPGPAAVVPGPAAPPPTSPAPPPPPGAIPPGTVVSSGLLTPDAARPELAVQRPVQPSTQGRRAPRHRAMTPPEAP
ncbi:hypothetical protein D4740_09965 [Actinomyces sp. 2119]|uniref:hypothetical protein n=1 Tax=Actinomyces sp. 2119 TaxID=2321393 RepID=UPI000E6CD79F|nr:hypothetical protein [Actinomyces sp. 2119]RJF41223.1 hypothetical protein D4740_09965 [Actinomyces sp. 2119]